MNKSLMILTCLILISACNTFQSITSSVTRETCTIAFGSCNNQRLDNFLWKEIVKHQPVAWIWGGDNTYSDTDNMLTLWKDYQMVLANKDYQALQRTSEILATWDDHDYGMNDGGETFYAKKASQQVFLDFLGVAKTDRRRSQEGIYYIETLQSQYGKVKIFVLDTRYFRTDLTKHSTDKKKRYQPNPYGQGTILGKEQWAWLEKELKTSDADFNIIVSSIQVLSSEHGFETWGNMPHEVDRLKNLIKTTQAKGVLILSGDRHFSEFSKTSIEGVPYPLIDFTSSGLTHAFSGFVSEYNPYRVGEAVPKISYGLLFLNFKNKEIKMQIRGKNDSLFQELTQKY